MAGKTGCICSPAAPLSRPANTGRRAKKAIGPAESPGQHKRSTRATHEEHKRPTRYAPAIPWLALGLCLACNWLVPHMSVLFRILPSAFCLRTGVALDTHCAACNMIVPHRIPKGFRLKAQGCELAVPDSAPTPRGL